MSLQGVSANQTAIDANALDRALHVLNGARLTIENISVIDGNADMADGGGLSIGTGTVVTLTRTILTGNLARDGGAVYSLGTLRAFNSTIGANVARAYGGGIRNAGGMATLVDSTITGNQAAEGGGIRNDALGYLAVNGSLIQGNRAGSGGGISNSAASADLSGATVAGNDATSGTGGGISSASLNNTPTQLTLVHCMIIGNRAAGSGGGIFNSGIQTTLALATSTLSHNQSTVSGGGLFNYGLAGLSKVTIDHNSAHGGGGIRNNGGNLNLTNATITDNSAQNDGGGLLNDATASLLNVTFSGNSAAGAGGAIFNAASVVVKNTIVANSPAGGNCFSDGTAIVSSGHNLDSGATCGFSAVGDLVNADPHLGTLHNNGGALWTQALLTGSPAINAGDNVGCPSSDERGAARQNVCDMGAYENGVCMLAGDANHDGQIDVTDIQQTAARWPLSAPVLDQDGNGVITVGDVQLITAAFGQACY